MFLRKIKSVVILFSLYIGLMPAAQAQQCIPSPSLRIAEIGGKYPGADGLIHVTVQFADANGNPAAAPSSLGLDAQFAMDDWNRYSSTTGVVFEMAPPGTTGDIQIMPTSDPDLSANCAAMEINTGRLYYTPGVEQRFSTAAIFAHEFGHYLGLNEAGSNPSSPTIMNNPPPPDPLTPSSLYCKSAGIATTRVQPNDAAAVAGCIAQAQNDHDPFPLIAPSFPYHDPIYYPTPYYYTPCYNLYEVTDFYSCVGTGDGGWDCEYQGSEYTLVFSTC